LANFNSRWRGGCSTRRRRTPRDAKLTTEIDRRLKGRSSSISTRKTGEPTSCTVSKYCVRPSDARLPSLPAPAQTDCQRHQSFSGDEPSARQFGRGGDPASRTPDYCQTEHSGDHSPAAWHFRFFYAYCGIWCGCSFKVIPAIGGLLHHLISVSGGAAVDPASSEEARQDGRPLL